MHIVDPHVHVWTQNEAYPWPEENPSPPTTERSVEMLIELMEAHGVERTVLIQSIEYRWDNSYAAHAMHSHPGIFQGVCRVNPEDPQAPDHLIYWTEEQGFHGVRLSPRTGVHDDWFTGPLMDPLFQRATALGVPILILTKPDRLPDLADILERHPDLDVCIDHMADCPPEDEQGVQNLLDLARYPRVHVKISHTWGLSNKAYPWRDTWGLVQRVVEAYGVERCMWGTDWPVCLEMGGTYGQSLRVVRDEMDFFTTNDLEWILSKTVLKLWPFAFDA